MTQNSFPQIRLRRLREHSGVRKLVRETRLHRDDLVMPAFIRSGKKEKRAINAMPGMFQFSPDAFLKEAEAILKAGVSSLLLFGIPEKKDAEGSWGSKPDGVVQQATCLLKKEFPELTIIVDVCLCDYTDHGHCGIVHEEGGKKMIDNDASLEALSKIAGSLARAGADVIAPSDMMDGRVQKIRDELDAAGFKHLPILSYAVKYASSFYGPFRDALESAPQFGDRKTYQMDPANASEAIREAEQDVLEGADMLMVKPALPYLDIVRSLKEKFPLPIAAYQVSGEYSSIKLAAGQNLFDEEAVVLETWTAMKRAGADILITYFAKEFAGLI